MAKVSTVEDNIRTYSFILPPESWGVFAYAETYVSFQLGTHSGARVFISENSKEVKAVGTTEQLHRLQKAINDIKAKSLRCGKNGRLSIVGSMSIFFEGLDTDESLKFEKYVGLCQRDHESIDKFIPYLMKRSRTPTGADVDAFQSKFLSQWRKVRDEYNPIFHGELCVILTFGNLYFMHIKDKVLSVRQLNEHLEAYHDKLDEFLSKIGKGQCISPVPYRFSFIADSKQPFSFKIFLRNEFCKEKSVKKVKVRVDKFEMCDLDENLCFEHKNVPNIDWFDGRIRKAESHCPQNKLSVTCKLTSYRDIHWKDLQRTKDHRQILEHDGSSKLCEKSADGFIVCNKNVTFIREKETDIYSAQSLSINKEIHVQRSIQVEVSKVREFVVCPENGKCMERPERQEVAVIPCIPNLKATDDEIKCYANDLWNIALFFGDKLNVHR